MFVGQFLAETAVRFDPDTEVFLAARKDGFKLRVTLRANRILVSAISLNSQSRNAFSRG